MLCLGGVAGVSVPWLEASVSFVGLCFYLSVCSAGGAAGSAVVWCRAVAWGFFRVPSAFLLQMIEQNCTFLNWNVRGLNNKARRDVVCNLVRDCRATIVALQETKLESISDCCS